MLASFHFKSLLESFSSQVYHQTLYVLSKILHSKQKITKISVSIMSNPLFSFEECCSDVNYHPRGFINESALKPALVLPAEDMGNEGGALDNLWAAYGLNIASPLEKATPFTICDGSQFCQDSMAIDNSNFHAISNAMQMFEGPTAAFKGAPDMSVMTATTELFSLKEKCALLSFHH